MFQLSRVLILGAVVALGVASGAIAKGLTFFTIGTGGTAYTYYPVGGVIANAISKPPGSRECDEGGSCGVEGLVATAVSSRGSVDNIYAIVSGGQNSGFSQSDIAFWAYTGTGTMAGKKPATNLRAIASLFEEHIHLVTLSKSGIHSVSDLKGKRASLDERESGTYVDATLILQANGITINDIIIENFKGAAAAEALRSGKIDAFFVVAGYPTGLIVELASVEDISLVPIDGKTAADLTAKYGFFSKSVIPAGTYTRIGETPTLAVGALWLTNASESEDLIYKITRSLWNEKTRKLLDEGHVKGRSITLETALNGIDVPLHPGTERYYREAGLLK